MVLKYDFLNYQHVINLFSPFDKMFSYISYILEISG